MLTVGADKTGIQRYFANNLTIFVTVVAAECVYGMISHIWIQGD